MPEGTNPHPVADCPVVSTHDFIIVGSGPAGRRAAIQAAKLGKSVLVVEKGRRVGGVSVHTGTIPSKTLRETVLNLTGWRERGFYGRAYRVKKDIQAKDLMARLHMTLDHEVDVLEHQFARNGVHTITGMARFLDPHRIEVETEGEGTRVFLGQRILLAVGTRPHRPPEIPFDGKTVLDSDEIVEIDYLPRSLTVIGAGVIGLEYATIFSALDVAVTLVDTHESFLDFIDRELIDDFTHQLRDRGMAIRLGSKVTSIALENGRPVTVLESGRRIRSDMLLCFPQAGLIWRSYARRTSQNTGNGAGIASAKLVRIAIGAIQCPSGIKGTCSNAERCISSAVTLPALLLTASVPVASPRNSTAKPRWTASRAVVSQHMCVM